MTRSVETWAQRSLAILPDMIASSLKRLGNVFPALSMVLLSYSRLDVSMNEWQKHLECARSKGTFIETSNLIRGEGRKLTFQDL